MLAVYSLLPRMLTFYADALQCKHGLGLHVYDCRSGIRNSIVDLKMGKVGIGTSIRNPGYADRGHKSYEGQGTSPQNL